MTAGQPTISVVIPTYNRADLLPEAIDSVLAQGFDDYELLVVDDGSVDETRTALAPYGDRIRYFYQENRGESAARNLGIRESRGEWVAFLDSDDLWEPRTLETLHATALQYPRAGLIAMRARFIRPDGSIERRSRGKKSRGPYFTTASLLWGDPGGVWTPMVRRSVLLEAGGFNESLPSAPDCDMWIRLSFITTLVGIPDALLLRRVHEGNISLDRALNARSWLRILDDLEREHPEFVEHHPIVYRRTRGKENLRLGRALLRAAGDRATVLEARGYLLQSIRSFPFFLRAYRSLLLSYLR